MVGGYREHMLPPDLCVYSRWAAAWLEPGPDSSNMIFALAMGHRTAAQSEPVPSSSGGSSNMEFCCLSLHTYMSSMYYLLSSFQWDKGGSDSYLTPSYDITYRMCS